MNTKAGGEIRKLPDSELLARLAYEVQRAALVWNYFAGTLIDGWYPGRTTQSGGKFEGSDRELIEQLFKIRDHETRHLLEVLNELNLPDVKVDYEPVYDDLSAATEITSMSHKPL
ncbi:MAG: hypothetical protein KA066_01480 [Candidatus Pacebacteria bacterium]|nr:hypothetical protein [Candidatus Paceibacterota bacterium]